MGGPARSALPAPTDRAGRRSLVARYRQSHHRHRRHRILPGRLRARAAAGVAGHLRPVLRNRNLSSFRLPTTDLLVDQLTDFSALRITSVTACGCEIMITCEPSISRSSAPARLAIESRTSEPAALSPVATTAQDGNVFQAGTPDFSSNADAATGRCEAPRTAACDSGRSRANTS